jgi:hypothetical protein
MQCIQEDIAGNWVGYLISGNSAGTQVCKYSIDNFGSISNGFCNSVNADGKINEGTAITGNLLHSDLYTSGISLTTLNGDGTGIEVGINALLPTGSQSRTYVAWIQLMPSDAGYMSIFSHGSVSSYQQSKVYIHPDGALHYDVQVGSVVAPSVALFDGKIHMVSITFSVTNGVNMYVDGESVSSASSVYGFFSSEVNTININNKVAVGFDWVDFTNGSTPDVSNVQGLFKGGIGNVAIWGSELTADDINTLFINQNNDAVSGSFDNFYTSTGGNSTPVGISACNYTGTISYSGGTSINVTNTLIPGGMATNGIYNSTLNSGSFSAVRVP